MKKKRVILANAPIKNGNRGCVALSYVCIYLIDKILGRGNYILYLTDSSETNGYYSISINDSNINYESISIPKYKSLFGSSISFFKLKNLLQIFTMLMKADYVLDIGQGDSFADIYGMGRFKSIDSIHRIARLFKKPYFLLPQTIGPFSDEKIKTKASKSIRKASFVMTRDKQSYDYVVEIAPTQKNLCEYIDLAFLLPYKKVKFDKNYIHVGLNISALLWHGGYTEDNQFGLKCNYQKIIRQIIEYFLSIPEIVFHLIPHVVGTERHVENDYSVSYSLQREYNNERLVLAPLFLTPIDAKSYISGLDFFIGARMHATIAAFSSGVPVVPMAYSRKFNGLFLDTLHYNNIVDMKIHSEEEIFFTIKNAYNRRKELQDIIEDRMNGVVMFRKQNLLNDLSKLLK